MEKLIKIPQTAVKELTKPENLEKFANVLNAVADALDNNKDAVEAVALDPNKVPKRYNHPSDNDLAGDGCFHISGKENDKTIIGPSGDIQWAPFTCNQNEIDFENSLPASLRYALETERYNNNLMANKLADMFYDICIMGLDYMTVANAHRMVPLIRHVDIEPAATLVDAMYE